MAKVMRPVNIAIGLGLLWLLMRPKSPVPHPLPQTEIDPLLEPLDQVPYDCAAVQCFMAPCGCEADANQLEPTAAELAAAAAAIEAARLEREAALVVDPPEPEAHPDDINGYDYYDTDHDGRIGVSELSRAISDKNRGLASQADVDRVTARYNIRVQVEDGMIRTGQYLVPEIME